MSDDNLESLDNASLRKKCLEFGLPNVPVTDTSRHLLIRRLRAAMTGDTGDKTKNRRKTIHVSKIPSPVETTASAPVEEAPKPPASRTGRRTIAATNVTSTVDDLPMSQTQKPGSVTERRRSVRSQVAEEPTTSIPISQKRKTAAVVEEEDEYDEDDYDDDIILLEAAEKTEREIIIPRTRRSVSLTKTGVVTTSYSQEKVVTPPTVNETESESENDFVTNYANSYEPLTRPVTQPRESTYEFAQPPVPQPTRESVYGFAQPAQPPKPRESTYGYSQPQLPQEKTFGLSQRKPSDLYPSLSTFSTTSVNRTSIEPEVSYKPSSYTPRYSSLASGHSSESSTTTSTTRRYTTSGLGVPSSGATKYTSTTYNDEEEDEENEAPYLSDFARKLERLKAEPLAKGLESPRNASLKRDTQRYTSSIVGRRSTSQKDTVSESFKNLFIALDRKYNLKRNIAIAFAIILMIFIYIVFVR